MAEDLGSTRSSRIPRSSRQTTVPVASRERAAQQPPAPRRQAERIDLVGYGVIAVVVLIVLFAIAVPLRNYYQGRTEIARLNESIAAKSADKELLISEIERYQDEEFIQQEARRRLGVVEPGETAWRIIDPRMNAEHTLTTPQAPDVDDREWYEVLWDSVAVPPEAVDTQPDAPEEANEEAPEEASTPAE